MGGSPCNSSSATACAAAGPLWRIGSSVTATTNTHNDKLSLAQPGPRKRFSLLQAACKSPCWPLSVGLGKHLYDAPELCGSMCHLPEQLISLATSESTQLLPAARKISQHFQEPFGDLCSIVPNAAFTSSIYEQQYFFLIKRQKCTKYKHPRRLCSTSAPACLRRERGDTVNINKASEVKHRGTNTKC